MGQTTELYKGENMFCHAYKCSNLARKMRIRLKATSVGIGLKKAFERTGPGNWSTLATPLLTSGSPSFICNVQTKFEFETADVKLNDIELINNNYRN